MAMTNTEANLLIDQLADAREEVIKLRDQQGMLFAALAEADLLILDLREDLRVYARASLERGIEQSARGETVYLGSFAQYAEDDQ